MSWQWLAVRQAVPAYPEGVAVWHDVDCSAFIPASASGVIIHTIANNIVIQVFEVRANGSADENLASKPNDGPPSATTHIWHLVGVDANRIFETKGIALGGPLAGCIQYVEGYTEDETVHFLNAINVTPGGSAVWTDVDVSASVPANAQAAIVRHTTVTGASNERPNGSGDNRISVITGARAHSPLKLDAGRIFEVYKSAAGDQVWLRGYVTRGLVLNTNYTDVSLAGIGAYADLPTLGASGKGGLYHLRGATGNYTGALRPKGSALDDYYGFAMNAHGMIEAGTGQIIQCKIANVAVDTWYIGYIEEVPPVFAGEPFPEDLPWTPPSGSESGDGSIVTLTGYWRPFERKLEVKPLPALRLLRP